MSEFVEVKTGELAGNQLRYAMGKAMGLDIRCTGDSVWVKGEVPNTSPKRSGDYYNPLCWSEGGPLLEKYIWSLPYRATERYHLGKFEARTPGGFQYNGGSPLAAACRAIVATELGEVVRIPAVLTGSDR